MAEPRPDGSLPQPSPQGPPSEEPGRTSDLGLISPDLGPDGDEVDDEAAALAWCEEEGLIWDDAARCWSLPEDMED